MQVQRKVLDVEDTYYPIEDAEIYAINTSTKTREK